MHIILSAAISADGYLDDMADTPLTFSSREDIEDVHALRAMSDAILVGANTYRNDNPSLTVRHGNTDIQPAKIVMTRSGNLNRNTRFFTEGAAEKIVLTSGDPCDHLKDIATIIPFDGSAHDATCQLQAHGIKTLMIEGGAQIQQYFLDADAIDEIRLSKNQHIIVNDPRAPAFPQHALPSATVMREQTCGQNSVTWHATAKNIDQTLLRHAVAQAEKSPAADRYRVGCVIADTHHRIISTGFTQETDATCHAEQAAIDKALKNGFDLTGCAIYSSMEPCSKRASASKSCSERIIDAKFKKVVYAYREPAIFVDCEGHAMLEKAGLTVIENTVFAPLVIRQNGHLLSGA